VPEIYGFSLLDNWCEKAPLKKDNSKKRGWNTNNKKKYVKEERDARASMLFLFFF
jgi:hypothetical protein